MVAHQECKAMHFPEEQDPHFLLLAHSGNFDSFNGEGWVVGKGHFIHNYSKEFSVGLDN